MNPAVLTFISAVAASVVAALLVAAILYIGRWLPTSIYPDLRGTWLITIREGDFVLDEQAKIKYQLRWWFSGKVHDSQGRPTRISEPFKDDGGGFRRRCGRCSPKKRQRVRRLRGP